MDILSMAFGGSRQWRDVSRLTHYRSPMYLDYYGLREAPFAITPDPRFVYLSDRHREALAHLRYGIAQGGSGGFVLLTGDIGTGKTTLSRLLLGQLPAGTQAALLLNPKVSALELLQSLCDELGIAVDPSAMSSSKSLVDALNLHLLAAHARGGEVVVVVDEAQNLSTDALEQVRLLTNLETPTAKLLQVVLLGQPELREVLARADLAQLAQRITARYHLGPLDAHETGNYLRHRLAVAGSKRFPFPDAAVRALHARAGGVPRRINIIADRALTGAYAQQANEIGVDLVQRAADEALGETSTRRRPWFALAFGSLLVAATLALALSASRKPATAVSRPVDAHADSPGIASSRPAAATDMPEAEPEPAVAIRAAANDPRESQGITADRYFPPDLPATLAQGAQGASVEWLEGALAAVQVPVDPGHVAGRYDASLVVAVRAAQRRFGLREDGVAGRETQWVLASRAAAAAGQPAPPQTSRELPAAPRPLDSAPSLPH